MNQSQHGAETAVVALYRKDPLQVGDVVTTPANYAKELGLPWLQNAEHLDVEDSRIKNKDPDLEQTLRNSIVIIGGGGLTFDYFRDNITRLTTLKPRALIWWGAGHNIHLGEGTFLTHGRWEDLTDEELSYPSYLSSTNFDLIGVRDPEDTQFEKPPFRYVPCPSVMLESLDVHRNTPAEHEAVLYVQKSRYPNRVAGLPDAVQRHKRAAQRQQSRPYRCSVDSSRRSRGPRCRIPRNRQNGRDELIPWSALGDHAEQASHRTRRRVQ